ncbi:Murein L,D-transpeptidase YcbB/YkuD [Cyclobacterium xiamenense]|uniref:Murein L,D-transpeptidase YcbB/YkuD n=1 Tax=Cyclobacterium xiamenense TaxID=1297121 RepID=A0A1H6Y356_9BACT|nr:L,D-transpeptidase family protein [Cyclobacterium xiamenense]SEJ35709.1 Murein L,D-transpeptidase YcbB/YkuD [Cyclobacterium xiamenense]
MNASFRLRFRLPFLVACLTVAHASVLALPNNAGTASEIRSILERDETQTNTIFGHSPIHAKSHLLTFYSERAFAPAWSAQQEPTCEALELWQLIGQAGFDGLLPEDYHLLPISELIARFFDTGLLRERELALLDVLLSDAFIGYAHHLYQGKIHPEHVKGVWNIQTKRHEPRVLEKLNRALATKKVREELFSLRPKFPIYDRMRTSMKKYAALAREYTDQNEPIPTTEKPLEIGQRYSQIPTVREKLIFWKDLEMHPVATGRDDLYDSILAMGVKNFQRRNGLQADGVIGRGTLEALNQSAEILMNKLAVNMERLRWLPDTTLQEFILVNIAGYSMDFISEQDTLLHSNAIVGKTYRKTPVFNAAMSYLVFSPTWTIPPTILKNDVLPSVRKNNAYLSQKNMRILDHSGREINPDEIKWDDMTGSNFPYLIRQDPGPANSLGSVKFMFPNQYDVYIHDTPSRELFYREDRALSSGCIRIQKPFELAQLLLKDRPLWTDERIRSAMQQKNEQVVMLNRKIPVIILYLTIWTDSNGRDNVRKDIYNRDTELLHLLRQPLLEGRLRSEN